MLIQIIAWYLGIGFGITLYFRFLDCLHNYRHGLPLADLDRKKDRNWWTTGFLRDWLSWPFVLTGFLIVYFSPRLQEQLKKEVARRTEADANLGDRRL